MFGQNKPTGFGTPFGVTNTAQTPAFGSGGSTFNTPVTRSMFGTTPTATPGGGLFGSSTTSTFGSQPANTSFNFSSTPSSSGGLFGQKTTASGGLFSSTPAANTSGFTGFGGSTGFGTNTSTATGGGLFGVGASTGTSLFGTTQAGFGQQVQAGTTIPYNPPQGQDSMVKGGVTQQINTKHQCITAMKEYESKSLEELRVEDYQANRKGKQAGAAGGFGFTGQQPATATQQSSGFSFGGGAGTSGGFGQSTGFGTSTSTGTGGLFGQTQPAGGGLFGQASQNKPLFGSNTTTTQSGFGFGTNTSTGTGLFGQTQQNKPLFGTTTTTQSGGLFGAGGSTFGQPAASSGFGGFGTTQSGGLFGNKPAFGTQTTAATTGFGGFGAGANTGSNLFNKPFTGAAASTGFGFPSATTQAGAFGSFGAAKPAGFTGLTTSSAAPSFGFSNPGTSLFGNTGLNKPAGFGGLGTTGTTGFGGFGATATNQAAPALGGAANPGAANMSAQLQQTLLTLTQSPYGDNPLFWNMKDTSNSAKREELLKPTNPAAQKALLAANQHKVSPRPLAKIKPKALTGSLNGSKSQLFDGLEDDDFGFGNDTFQPRKSVKKLTLNKLGQKSGGTPSRSSSISGDPHNMSNFREDDSFRARCLPVPYPDSTSADIGDHVATSAPPTEQIIRSKGLSEQMGDTPNRGGPNMDDTIALLNARNKSPASGSEREPSLTQLPHDTVNISIISRDESTHEETVFDERPTTPPPPHPAGIQLSRPGYYTIPNFEALAELVDKDGNCYVEDFTIGREGYGSIFFPGITNITNMNFDEIVFFRRKEVIVYPDDDNKPPEGEGLNKKAEITLDCVWPRDKSAGTPVKSPEKLQAMRWQEKIESNSLKVGARFLDYRPETGSWVFEVKHFSKYGLVDDSDDEELSEQDKKQLRAAQQQQIAVQKQKLHQEQLSSGDQGAPLSQQTMLGSATSPGGSRVAGVNSQRGMAFAQFTIGTDDESEGSSRSGGVREGVAMGARYEVPMGEDDQMLDAGDHEERTDMDLELVEEQPSSHRLAASMGLDARNMQVMKASFFGDEDVPARAFDGSMFVQKSGLPTGSPLLRNREGTGPSLFSSTALKSKYMSPVRLPQQPEPGTDRGLFSPRLITPEPIRAMRSEQPLHPPVKEYMLLESGMTQRDYQQRSLGSRISKVIPAVQEGYEYNKQALHVDAGLFMGRSFRVGWGPGWTLAHTGDIVQPKDEDERPTTGFNLFSGGRQKPSTNGSTNWNVHLQKINVADHLTGRDKTVIQNHVEMLEIQLVHSRSTKEGSVPVFTPAPGVDALHQYAERNQDELDNLGGHPDECTVKHMGMVWDLCVALWGNMPQFKDIDVEKDSYTYHSARREAFSQWLSTVSAETIKQEVQKNKYKDQGHLDAILSSLTGCQLVEACQLAQSASDHRLALLLAQAISNYMPRQMVSKYLDEVVELMVTGFVNETRLKIYSLLAGQLVLCTDTLTVNTCEHLDWKRALALHLWFSCQADSPIQEAFEVYERSYRGSQEFGAFCNPPLPPYLEETSLRTGGFDLAQGEQEIWDTCYHLLSLYCQRSGQLEHLLSPTTSSPNQLDYRLSWHMSQVLQGLSYRHLSPYHRASVHMNFAAHLESLGLWEWAVFAALHIDNTISRESAVRSILCRHIQLSEEEAYLEKEELLRGKLLVPEHWIHDAKALRASYENKPADEAWHLLKSGQWNRSHTIILKELAADYIIQEKYGDLLRYLTEMSTPAHSATILNWHIGGKVLLEYIHICNSMSQISQQSEPNMYELDRLLPEVKALCAKVGSLPCRNTKDRVCQSEMAKKTANFLRAILSLQAEARGEAQPPLWQIAPYISNLPMPEDYFLHELRTLTRSHMMEVVSS